MRTIAPRAKINKHKQAGVRQMKLVELLAKELKEWPAPDKEYGQIESMSQAADFQVSHYAGVRQKWREDLADWDGSVGDGYIPCSRFTLSQLATDHATAIVTRPQWQAEKARIAGEVDGGWKRHRGGKQPVADGARVDYRMRSGRHGINERSELLDWGRSDESPKSDIMAYRIHKPAEQPAAVSEEAIQVGIDAADAGKLTPIAEVKARFTGSHAGILLGPQPLAWRDRIRELDTQRAELEATYQRQIGEIDGERGELVERLASEGLALVDVAVQAADPDFDAEDKSTWRVCDVVEIASSDNDCWRARKGMQGQLNYDSTIYLGGWYIKFDSAGDWCVSDNTELKFHSRPSS